MSNRSLFDKIIVIDLEASCDDPRPSWSSEVIEIGVCLLDRTSLEITDKRSILVKPENTPITPFCTSLTTITKEMLDSGGVSLQEAIKILVKEYKIDKRLWCSWGYYDYQTLTQDCAAKGIKCPYKPRQHINLKPNICFTQGWDEQIDVKAALSKFGLEFEGTHHRGHDDAYNIAKIFAAHMRVLRKNH